MVLMLFEVNSIVIIVYFWFYNLEVFIKNVDIFIIVVGRLNMIIVKMVKLGVVVIDVGINRVIDEGGNSWLVGDV